MSKVLEGVRVLDFGRYIAGPFCGMLLADMGAEVIRIEKRDGSEDRYVTPVAEGGEGAMFLQINRNKLSMTLNPMKPEGREIVKKLVATADVVIANLPPQTLEAMGLDYDSLKETKPDIILATVSAFGHGGPYSHRVGFDGVAQALSGGAYMGGRPDDPIKSYVPWVDYGTASLTAFGTMAALMERNKTGKGQKVEGALTRTAMTFNNPVMVEQAVIGANRIPSANRSQTSGPSDLYTTKDTAVIVQIVGRPLFERWAKLMGEDHWLTDPRFKDDISCGNNGEVLSERMQAWCSERTTVEVLAALDDARIPCGPVYKPAEALEDPHVKAMDFLQEVDYPGLPRPAPIATTPVKLSDTPGTIERRAPTLGEHTEQILNEIGYDSAAIASLRQAGII